jgi:hypothetical protein
MCKKILKFQYGFMSTLTLTLFRRSQGNHLLDFQIMECTQAVAVSDSPNHDCKHAEKRSQKLHFGNKIRWKPRLHCRNVVSDKNWGRSQPGPELHCQNIVTARQISRAIFDCSDHDQQCSCFTEFESATSLLTCQTRCCRIVHWKSGVEKSDTALFLSLLPSSSCTQATNSVVLFCLLEPVCVMKLQPYQAGLPLVFFVTI